MQKSIRYLITNLQLFGEGDETPPAQEQEAQHESGAEDYIETIKQLKANTVPKQDFENLKKENKSLLSALIDGKVTPEMKQAMARESEPAENIEDLRKTLFAPDANVTNLAFTQAALKLRKALIEKDGPSADPFLGRFDPSISRSPAERAEERQNAEDTAARLQEIVDASNGDPNLFQGLLQGVLVDDPAVTMAIQKRKREEMQQKRRK